MAERAGSRALSIFTHRLRTLALRAHASGPLRPGELEEALGWAPQSSLRAAVGAITELGLLGPVDSAAGTRTAARELTAAGRELLGVADALELWLRGSPDRLDGLDDPGAPGIVKVLIAGWDSEVIRALAERPLTLSDLNGRIGGLNYPALKRRLAKLRSTHLVVPAADGTSAVATSEWLRRAVVPLALAARWERRHDPGAAPISGVEVEAAFLLALPLVEMASTHSGRCMLTVLTASDRTGDLRKVAGITLEVERGRIVSHTIGPDRSPSTWALGTADSWFDAVIAGGPEGLRIGGDSPRLATSLVRSLHTALLPYTPRWRGGS